MPDWICGICGEDGPVMTADRDGSIFRCYLHEIVAKS